MSDPIKKKDGSASTPLKRVNMFFRVVNMFVDLVDRMFPAPKPDTVAVPIEGRHIVLGGEVRTLINGEKVVVDGEDITAQSTPVIDLAYAGYSIILDAIKIYIRENTKQETLSRLSFLKEPVDLTTPTIYLDTAAETVLREYAIQERWLAREDAVKFRDLRTTLLGSPVVWDCPHFSVGVDSRPPVQEVRPIDNVIPNNGITIVKADVPAGQSLSPEVAAIVAKKVLPGHLQDDWKPGDYTDGS